VGDDETFTVCPRCGGRVEPADPGVVYAVEQREILTMGPTRETVDGMGGFFHPVCPPEGIDWVRRERPAPPG
jgi:hypothetical protein